jgi:uncharacterized protein (TIGR01777 family)
MDKKYSVLIAGATGFIGKELVGWLLANGMLVTVLTRNPFKAKNKFPHDVNILKWPSVNEKLLMAHCKTCDVVINLSGASIGAKRWTKSYKSKIRTSRSESILNLKAIIDAMSQIPSLWIQASAIGFYGPQPVENIDESGNKGAGFLADVVDGLETELNKIKVLGMRKVTLRLGIVINKNGGFLKQMMQAFNYGLGVIPGNGQQYISWIHSDDLIEVIAESIVNNKYAGVINAVAPKAITFYDFAHLLKMKTRALFVTKVPACIFKILLGVEKTNQMLLANQSIKSQKLKTLGFSFKYPDLNSVFNR